MFSPQDIIFLYLTGLATVCLFYVIGFFSTSIFNLKENKYFLPFYGCMVTVGLFAVFLSRFSSVFSSVLVLLITIGFLKPRKLTTKALLGREINIGLKFFLPIVLIYCLSFFYFLFLFLDFSELEPKYFWYDIVHYATVSRGMSFANCENITANFYLSKHLIKDLMLWHYFDLWLNVAINKFSSFGYYNSLVFIVYPVLQTVFFQIIFGLFKSFNKTIYLFPVIFLMPFAIKTPFLKYEGFLNILGLKQNFSSLIDVKLFIIYIMVFVSGFMYINKRYISALFFLSTLSLIYVTTFISILPSVLIFLLAAKFLNNKPNQTFKTAFIIYSVLCVLHLFLLYTNNPSNLGFYEKQQIEIVSSIKTILVVFAETIIKYTIVYAPSLIVIIYSFLKLKSYPHFRHLILFFFTMLITSIFVCSIFHGSSVEFGQSLYNIAPPIFITLLIFSIYFLVKDNGTSKATTNFIVVLFSLIGLIGFKSNLDFPDTYGKKYSIDYKKKVLKTFRNTPTPKYITIANYDLEFYKQHSRSNQYIIIDTIAHLNKYYSNRMDAFLSNSDNTPLGYDLSFVTKNNSKSNSFLNKFIEENNINYVFIDKELSIDRPYSVICKDSLSGETFAKF